MEQTQEIKKPKITVETKWLSNLMQQVYDMRQAQKEYFLQPSEYRLKLAKVKEQQVDITITHAISNGYVIPVKKEITNNNQSELFNENTNNNTRL